LHHMKKKHPISLLIPLWVPLFGYMMEIPCPRASSSCGVRNRKSVCSLLSDWVINNVERGFLSNWALFCCRLADLWSRGSIGCVMDGWLGGGNSINLRVYPPVELREIPMTIQHWKRSSGCCRFSVNDAIRECGSVSIDSGDKSRYRKLPATRNEFEFLLHFFRCSI
jgi:hypothetical protein